MYRAMKPKLLEQRDIQEYKNENKSIEKKVLRKLDEGKC